MAGATGESLSGTLEEKLTVKGLADEPMKFLMFGARDCHLEDMLLPKEQSSLIRLPPFVDLTQLLKPMYIPLALLEQTNGTEPVITSEEQQKDAPSCSLKEQTYATEERIDATSFSPVEQVYTPEEQMNVTDEEAPKEKDISDDQASTLLGEASRKRARDEMSSPDSISPSNYTCIESDPASESVIDLTQDSP